MKFYFTKEGEIEKICFSERGELHNWLNSIFKVKLTDSDYNFSKTCIFKENLPDEILDLSISDLRLRLKRDKDIKLVVSGDVLADVRKNLIQKVANYVEVSSLKYKLFQDLDDKPINWILKFFDDLESYIPDFLEDKSITTKVVFDFVVMGEYDPLKIDEDIKHIVYDIEDGLKIFDEGGYRFIVSTKIINSK